VRAIRFHYRPVRYLASRLIGRGRGRMGVGRLGFVTLDDVEPPALPGADWVRVENTLAGVCGTDLSIVTGTQSFTLEPFSSYPFTFGHEVVGRVAEIGPAVSGWSVGERVAVHPMLACEQRRLPPCAACRRGETGLCSAIDQGAIGLGVATGFHGRVGGGWSGSLVAHHTQLLRVGGAPDSTAVLIEPFGVTLRGVALHPPADGDRVLVIGAGSIGLLTVAALRAIGWDGPIAVAGRYDFQLELAERAGADTLLRSAADAFRWAATLPGARSYRPTLAPRFVEGGPSLVYDSVGSGGSVRQCLAVAGAGGRIVMLGAVTRMTADWTRLWNRQLTLAGVIAYGNVPWQGGVRDSVSLAAELVRAGALAELPLVSHTFPLAEYRTAIGTALDRKAQRATKVAFMPQAA
jgi:L-iditol 2-dehydrogenase